MTDWQDISTAPRNPVLIWAPVYGVMVSSLEGRVNRPGQAEYDQWTGGGYGDPPPQPTHWMPLPDPPANPKTDNRP